MFRKPNQVKFVYVDQTTENCPRVFYVGKGNAVRVRNMKRNRKHSAIVKRYGIQRIIVFETQDEKIANEFEISKILEHKTLARSYHVSDDDFGCNFTRGGEGFSGIADVERQRRSDVMKARWADTDTRSLLIEIQNSEETKSKKSRAMKVWVASEKGREHLYHSLDMARNAVTSEARIHGQNQPETKKLKSKLMKQHCSEQTIKDKKSVDAQCNWKSQEYREKQRNSRVGWHPTEEHKRQISEKLKAYWIKKKAA